MKQTNIQKLKKTIVFVKVQEHSNDTQTKLMEDYCKKNNLQVIKRFEF